MRRRDFIKVIASSTAAWPLDAFAQQVSKMPTIGVLGVNVATWTLPMADFTQRLRELGWIEGRSIAIEYRWSRDVPNAW
jgi:putative tryptophan/tyrosine transport system substrate-binding protein